MATTLTRNLKLKVADDLSADAKYNLITIDKLGASTVTTDEDNLEVKSAGDIFILPQDASTGGSGNSTGNVYLGDSVNQVASFIAHTLNFRVRSALSLLNGSSGGNDTYLSLNGVSNDNTNATLTISLKNNSSVVSNRDISIGHSGQVVFEQAEQTLTNKTVTGTFTGSLTGNVTGNVSGTSANVTGIVAIANGGTGNNGSNLATALLGLLPSQSGNSNRVLGLNAGENGLEWKTFEAGGTVDSVSAPLVLSEDNKTISLPVATSSQNGYLSSTDWTAFSSYATTKQDVITGSGNPAQFWNGNKVFTAVTKSDVGLSNVDNTSDIDKPISSAVSTALAGKYDATNPSGFVDASGAKLASVTDDIDDLDQTLAPDCAAVKGYISAYGGGTYSTSWNPVSNPSVTITHDLAATTLAVSVYDNTGNLVHPDTVAVTSTQATLTATVDSVTYPAPAWTIVVQK